MEYFSSTIGLIHTLFAVAAMISGGVVVGLNKGTATHKNVGYIYFASMVILNVTALFTHALYEFGPFHWLAIGSLIGVLIGMAIPVFFRHLKSWLLWHYYFMLWSYVGLIAAFFAETIVRVPALNASTNFWQLVVIASVATYIIGGFLIEIKKNQFLRIGN